MIGVILDLSVKEERIDEFISMMKQILPETRAYEGCHEFNIWIDQMNEGRVLLNEIWDSQEKHQAYLGWREETGVLQKLIDMLNAPPEPMYFKILPS
ncbi:MAG: antibiotic biosynthesis monooxygenase [Pseudomonadota bacterium]